MTSTERLLDMALAVGRLTPKQRALCAPASQWDRSHRGGLQPQRGSYGCLECPKTYAWLVGLRRHIKTEHPHE